MKTNDIITTVLVSVVFAFAVSYMVDARLSEQSVELPEATETVASATTQRPAPEANKIPTQNAAVLRQKRDGHYWGLANVDGFPVNFMVDTGASVVVLTFEDARRLRLKPEDLDYKWKISTAGGQTFGASVLLESIKIGGVEIENVEAMVLRDDLEQSLLGMSFLSQLYSYEFRGKQLIIRK